VRGAVARAAVLAALERFLEVRFGRVVPSGRLEGDEHGAPLLLARLLACRVVGEVRDARANRWIGRMLHQHLDRCGAPVLGGEDSGVCPQFDSRALGSAPFESSAFTTSGLPAAAAKWSAVAPLVVVAFTIASCDEERAYDCRVAGSRRDVQRRVRADASP
jgi:hypothetical protein